MTEEQLWKLVQFHLQESIRLWDICIKKLEETGVLCKEARESLD